MGMLCMLDVLVMLGLGMLEVLAMILAMLECWGAGQVGDVGYAGADMLGCWRCW